METKPNSHDQTVGARLRLRRKQAAVSTDTLADLLAVTAEDIASFESGAARLGAARVAQASRALNVPIGYFFAGIDTVTSPPPAPAPAEALLATPGATELLSAYSRIANSPLRAAVLRLVQRLVGEIPGRVSPRLARTLSRARHSTSQAR